MEIELCAYCQGKANWKPGREDCAVEHYCNRQHVRSLSPMFWNQHQRNIMATRVADFRAGLSGPHSVVRSSDPDCSDGPVFQVLFNRYLKASQQE